MLVLCWFLEDSRISVLARGNAISVSTAYDDRDEGISVLAARRPGLLHHENRRTTRTITHRETSLRGKA